MVNQLSLKLDAQTSCPREAVSGELERDPHKRYLLIHQPNKWDLWLLSPMSDCHSQNRQLLSSQKHFCIRKHLQTELLFVRLSGTYASRIRSLSLGVCWVQSAQRLKLSCFILFIGYSLDFVNHWCHATHPRGSSNQRHPDARKKRNCLQTSTSF